MLPCFLILALLSFSYGPWGFAFFLCLWVLLGASWDAIRPSPSTPTPKETDWERFQRRAREAGP